MSQQSEKMCNQWSTMLLCSLFKWKLWWRVSSATFLSLSLPPRSPLSLCPHAELLQGKSSRKLNISFSLHCRWSGEASFAVLPTTSHFPYSLRGKQLCRGSVINHCCVLLTRTKRRGHCCFFCQLGKKKKGTVSVNAVCCCHGWRAFSSGLRKLPSSAPLPGSTRTQPVG